MYVVIPARGGSKGILDKNIKELNGKPLIQYTIETAREIFDDENIIVSTDSLKIKNIVEGLGLKVPFIRPKHLATDNAGTYEVLLHANAFMENKGEIHDSLILLQPTSPFRTAKHIKAAIDSYEKNLEMLVSVKETPSNPYYVLHEENKEGYLVKSKKSNFIRRQDCPQVWELNGAIYIINIAALKQRRMGDFSKVKKYVMDELSSIDLDTELDWKIAETILKNKE